MGRTRGGGGREYERECERMRGEREREGGGGEREGGGREREGGGERERESERE